LIYKSMKDYQIKSCKLFWNYDLKFLILGALHEFSLDT